MKAIIYRGTHEIGGTLIELSSGGSRILLDAGYPLSMNGKPRFPVRQERHPPATRLGQIWQNGFLIVAKTATIIA
jgi:Cft2 family RNA processing exonuclease